MLILQVVYTMWFAAGKSKLRLFVTSKDIIQYPRSYVLQKWDCSYDLDNKTLSLFYWITAWSSQHVSIWVALFSMQFHHFFIYRLCVIYIYQSRSYEQSHFWRTYDLGYCMISLLVTNNLNFDLPAANHIV
jgi:hypothetical protein